MRRIVLIVFTTIISSFFLVQFAQSETLVEMSVTGKRGTIEPGDLRKITKSQNFTIPGPGRLTIILTQSPYFKKANGGGLSWSNVPGAYNNFAAPGNGIKVYDEPKECIDGAQCKRVQIRKITGKMENITVHLSPLTYGIIGAKPEGLGGVQHLKIEFISDSDTPPPPPPVESTKKVLYANDNTYTVYNNPLSPTVFTFDRSYRITKITNYHWNNAKGSIPGTIALKSQSGQIYGPWKAKGTSGQGGVPNVYWIVYPNITLPPGTYTVIDSDPATWSQNSGSQGAGHVRIEGYEVSSRDTSGGMGTPNCIWDSYTNDQRQFATQPGGVFPMRRDYPPGNYQVHVGPAGKHGLDVPPRTWKTFGPYSLVAGSKYAAITYGMPIGLIWEKDSARLMMYSVPKAHAIVYVRNEILDQFYAVCLEPIN